ncbi:MAG: DUF2179 domain-containing protein [Sedimentisphaerales bacterium]|nr:DUF2179 domain-containing protein [Sedimentisphaerales bacterium]
MNVMLFIIVVIASFIIVRIGAIAFQLTGLEWSLAKFQSLSYFSGTGFTTREAELVTGHPQRRRIATVLIILGNAGLVRVVTKKDAAELVEYLKSSDYGVTSVDGHGTSGQVKVVFTIVPRRELKRVAELINKFNPQAFYSIEEVGFVEKGILPPKQIGGFTNFLKLFRPFRKGK